MLGYASLMTLTFRLAASVCVICCALFQARADDRTIVTVVELFTSQGCSSCPPADAFLGELANRDDVIALSQHVNYWDYLGWKDPYANAPSTDRQRAYALSLGLRYVYTPQLVLNGSKDFVGTNRKDVLAYIESNSSRPRPAIEIHVNEHGTHVVRIDASSQDHPADIWMIEFDRQHETFIERGENRGRKLINRNVVTRMDKIGRWRGTPVDVPISIHDCGIPNRGCAVLLQEEQAGRILAGVEIMQAHD